MKLYYVRFTNWLYMRKHGVPSPEMIKHILSVKIISRTKLTYCELYVFYEHIPAVAYVLDTTRERVRQVLLKVFYEWKNA